MQDKVVATIDDIRKNDRYYLSVFAFFVSIVVLLFSDKLDASVRDKIVTSLVVYAVGAALIAQIQNMLGNREALRCLARSQPFEGIHRGAFAGVCLAHVGWFLVLLYLLRGLLN